MSLAAYYMDWAFPSERHADPLPLLKSVQIEYLVPKDVLKRMPKQLYNFWNFFVLGFCDFILGIFFFLLGYSENNFDKN